jgi:hypothetical protein
MIGSAIIVVTDAAGLSTRIDRIDEIFDAEANPASRARACRQVFPSQRQTALPLDADD